MPSAARYGTMRRHGLDDVGDRKDSGLSEDRVASQPERVPRPVDPLVVLQDDVGDRPGEVDGPQDFVRRLRVCLHQRHLERREGTGLGEDLGRNRELADVVKESGGSRRLDSDVISRPSAQP